MGTITTGAGDANGGHSVCADLRRCVKQEQNACRGLETSGTCRLGVRYRDRAADQGRWKHRCGAIS